jgi:hypothetical protein
MPGPVKAAEHLGDAPDRLVVCAGLGDDLHGHHLAGLCIARVAGGNEDVLVDAAVFRDHETDAAFEIVATDDELVDVLQHLDDLGFATSAPVEAGHAHQHLVAMQHAVHFLGRQIQIVAALLRHHEAEAVRVALDAALDQVELVRQAQLTLAVEHQLAVALHRAKAALEQIALGLGDLQLLGKGVGVDRATSLGQQLKNVFAARQRRLVALDLTLVERVGQADRGDFMFACAAARFLR